MLTQSGFQSIIVIEMVKRMLSIGDMFAGHYKIIKKIGQGGMGVVFLAVDSVDGSNWANKEEKVTEQNRKLLFSEAEIMEKVTHPAFPRFRCRKEINGYFYLVMEYIDGHTLADEIASKKTIGESQAIEWFKQVCEALVYLHSLDTPVVYRDFKPSNLMIENTGRIRIIDLGIAQQYQGDGAKVDMEVLTRGYAAPEQYNKRYKLDARTDIYALAVTAHYMLTGKNPNEPPHVFVPVRKLRHSLSVAMEYILKKCLQPNPNKRYPNATLLLHDIENIEGLDKKLRAQARLRTMIVASLVSLAIVVSAAAYLINLGNRRASIEQYNAFMQSAMYATTLEDALQSIQNAVNLAPENPDAYILCAELYLEFDHIKEAYLYVNDVITKRFPDIYNSADFLELIEKLDQAK